MRLQLMAHTLEQPRKSGFIMAVMGSRVAQITVMLGHRRINWFDSHWGVVWGELIMSIRAAVKHADAWTKKPT
jgi:hypothetical protein